MNVNRPVGAAVDARVGQRMYVSVAAPMTPETTNAATPTWFIESLSELSFLSDGQRESGGTAEQGDGSPP